MEKGIDGTKPSNNKTAWSCDLCRAINVHGKQGSICGCGESRRLNNQEQKQVDINSIELEF